MWEIICHPTLPPPYNLHADEDVSAGAAFSCDARLHCQLADRPIFLVNLHNCNYDFGSSGGSGLSTVYGLQQSKAKQSKENI